MGYRPSDQRPQKSRNKSWDGNIHDLVALGHGVSGMVFAIDSKRVVKVDVGTPRSIKDIRTEREAYERLSGGHRYVLSCLDYKNPRGLVLQRCENTVRKRRQAMPEDEPSNDRTIRRWAYEAAKGLEYVHRCNIIQGDGQL
jgi:hypothetical protein